MEDEGRRGTTEAQSAQREGLAHNSKTWGSLGNAGDSLSVPIREIRAIRGPLVIGGRELAFLTTDCSDDADGHGYDNPTAEDLAARNAIQKHGILWNCVSA